MTFYIIFAILGLMNIVLLGAMTVSEAINLKKRWGCGDDNEETRVTLFWVTLCIFVAQLYNVIRDFDRTFNDGVGDYVFFAIAVRCLVLFAGLKLYKLFRKGGHVRK